MLRYSISLFLLLFAQNVFSQTLKLDGVTALAADKQGCCYVVTGNGVAKYNAKLELQSRHTTTFEKIESIDALDPFKISVFCKDFFRIYLLDNKLSLLGNPIFLPDVNVLRPSAACRSAENGMWIADSYRRQLLYLDFTLNTTREAASLSSYMNNDDAAIYMLERRGRVFVNFSGEKIAVFDKFGALLHLFSAPANKWFDVHGDTLYYLSQGKLYAQNWLSWSTPPKLMAEDVMHCAVADNVIFIYSSGVLSKIFAK